MWVHAFLCTVSADCQMHLLCRWSCIAQESLERASISFDWFTASFVRMYAMTQVDLGGFPSPKWTYVCVQTMSGLGTSLLKLWTDGLVCFGKRFHCILLPCHSVCIYVIYI